MPLSSERGANCAVVTTFGFGDVLEIGRGNRPDMYNNRYRRAETACCKKEYL